MIERCAFKNIMIFQILQIILDFGIPLPVCEAGGCDDLIETQNVNDFTAYENDELFMNSDVGEFHISSNFI